MKLKDCPFCGKQPNTYENKKTYVECRCINDNVTVWNNAAFDVKGWNNRPIEEELLARIKMLEDEISKLQNAFTHEIQRPKSRTS